MKKVAFRCGLFAFSRDGIFERLYRAGYDCLRGLIVAPPPPKPIAGLVFKLALDKGCSLNNATKTVADGIHKNRKGNEDILFPSADNIIKNYWPEFLPVAHFWAAMGFYTLPEPTDSTVIRLDLVTKRPQLDSKFSEGWRGILQVAQDLLNSASEAPRKQTSRPLLDPQKVAAIHFV